MFFLYFYTISVKKKWIAKEKTGINRKVDIGLTYGLKKILLFFNAIEYFLLLENY